jgi:hypothetical protein
MASVLHLPLRLDRVAARVLPGHAVLRQVHAVHARLGDPGGGAGNRREDGVLQGGHAPVRAPVGLHLRLDEAGDAQDPAATVHLVRDRNELNTFHLPDQRRPEIAERTAELSGEGFQEAVSLLLRRALVDERHDLPVAGENVPRDVADQNEAEA